MVGWVERSEPHQETAERQVVGLAALDPPYNYNFPENAPRTQSGGFCFFLPPSALRPPPFLIPNP